MTKRGGVGAMALAAASLLLLTGCMTMSAEPVPRGLTPAQRRVATHNELALEWAAVSDGAPGFTQPRVGIEHYTTYLDRDATIAGCLRLAGYPRTVETPTGVIDRGLTPQEAFPFSVAKYTCDAQYPEEPLELGYMTSGQSQYLYDYWEQDTIPCLRSRGVIVADLRPIGASGLGFPSVIDLNPYLKMRAPRGVTTSLLQSKCPPFPGELYATSPSVK